MANSLHSFYPIRGKIFFFNLFLGKVTWQEEFEGEDCKALKSHSIIFLNIWRSQELASSQREAVSEGCRVHITLGRLYSLFYKVPVINKIKLNLSICRWPISFSIMPLRFMLVTGNGSIIRKWWSHLVIYTNPSFQSHVLYLKGITIYMLSSLSSIY